ncbi:MAG TPA: heavy metal translocating P-type ATPase, partial [Limnochordales bacterium]
LLETVPVEQLQVGDIVQLLPGERLAVDGVVVQGHSAVDASAITGESIPVDRNPGDVVMAGSVNQHGVLWVRVTRPVHDSTLSRIIQLVAQAQEHKTPTQLFIERFERVYSAAVVALTVAMMVVPPLVLGWDWRTSLYRAMTVMVVASPCAVVLSTMPAMLSAVANGARRGVLFKGALYLEQLAHVKVMAFDKTGTLTVGRPEVTRVLALEGHDEHQLLAAAAGLEAASEHPIARAVVEHARARNVPVEVASETQVYPGRGLEGRVGPLTVRVGSPAWFAEQGMSAPPRLAQAVAELEAAGQTVMLVSMNGSGPVGAIAVADRLRPQAREAVQGLKALGVKRVVMLTGDNPTVARAVAQAAGVDEFFAGLLPEQKMQVLARLSQQFGPVAMVGDGINDAPALASAAVGIAMGRAGTDVALETADVVLMSDDLRKLEAGVALGRRAEQVVRQNLAFAFAVIAVLLALAAAGHLTLTQAVIGHEGSTVLVALNGLRLLGFRWKGAAREQAGGRSEPGRRGGLLSGQAALDREAGGEYTESRRADVAQW